MPKYIGGDIVEVACNHPDLGDFTFATKSNESYTLDPGGIRTNDDQNSVSGNGVFINQKNRVVWSFEGVFMADFSSNLEIENLPKLAESPNAAVWTIRHISGDTWRGTGVPVGDLQFDTNTAQVTMKISGGGALEKLSN